MASQCELLGLPRSTFYYQPAQETEENLRLMRLLDEQFTKTPFYGSRKFVAWFKREHGLVVNRKRVQRLMRQMGLEAIYPKPRTSQTSKEHNIYPYLLKGVQVDKPDFVWATDITYVPMQQGFMYLTVILDWYSRYVLSWELSNTLEARFCLDALEGALGRSKPEIFNSDQGCQYTSQAFTERLKSEGVQISMDGKGRCFDNIFVERLWRTVKYEHIYIHEYETVRSLYRGLSEYIRFYNEERPHQSLKNKTPAEVYRASRWVG